MFDEQADAIRRALAGRMITIEHVGSTAVPGLAKNPIIDEIYGRAFDHA
ncbi:GrpB family protein [Nocardia cerradoensis]|nr:GrpB family protein [Nocardia cerradoensis]NKY43800.1 GrpB family protein [Nocardia cerradoensis]